MPNFEYFNDVETNDVPAYVAVGTEATATYAVTVSVGAERQTAWKVRGAVGTADKAVWGVDSPCQFMKAVLPPVADLVKKSVVEHSMLLPREAEVFQRAYFNSEASLAALAKKLAAAKANLSQEVAAGQQDLINRYTIDVRNYTAAVASARDHRRMVLSNMPPESAFVAHTTYCTLTFQNKILGRKLV